MNTPRTLTRFLFMALTGIWGAVAYRVYTAAFASDPDREVATAALSPARSKPYVYKADVDDPFQSRVARNPIPRKALDSIAWTSPQIKVTGILTGNGKVTAILEDSKGEIAFLGEGDTTQGVKIIKIRAGLVLYSYHNKKKEWTIDGRQ